MAIITAPYQVQKLALEQIMMREARLIHEELARDWQYRELKDREQWLADEMASLDEWFQYLDRKHRDENTTGLPPPSVQMTPPKHCPFPRYFAMLGDEAAGAAMCDDIGALMIEIALIVSVQMSIGVSFGWYEAQRRTELRRLQKAATKKTSTTGTGTGSTAAAMNVPPVQHAP